MCSCYSVLHLHKESKKRESVTVLCYTFPQKLLGYVFGKLFLKRAYSVVLESVFQCHRATMIQAKSEISTGFHFKVLKRSYLRPVSHIRYCIHCYECFRILLDNIIHQFLIFTLVYNCNNFSVFLHIVCACRLVECCSAM